jgi:hypothetical protein
MGQRIILLVTIMMMVVMVSLSLKEVTWRQSERLIFLFPPQWK